MLGSLFYRNRRLTLLAIGLITVSGLAALKSLPRQEDPTLSRRNGLITTAYPGASALRVESRVTQKIEDELASLHEIKTIESDSRTGISIVQVTLLDRYYEADVDEIWSKVRDALSDAHTDFPPNTSMPVLEPLTTTATTLIVGLDWTQDDVPQLDLMTRLAEQLEERLANLPNTRDTDLHGESLAEVRVTVDGDQLAALGLGLSEVAAAIRGADAKVPAGQLHNASNDILIEVAGALDSVERIRRIPLIDADTGPVIRVADVARVEKTVLDPPQTLALIDGKRAIAVTATMEPDNRVDVWAARAHEVIEAFRSELPTGIEAKILFDQSEYTDERLSSLAGNLLFGAALVVAVLFFMMGTRSALIVGVALPLTLLLVLAELSFLGIPLHQTSVTGLIIALGLLIDNAIVVVDEYRTFVEKGHNAAQAVDKTMRHLAIPLLASTLTTVLSFLPIVLMPGGGGEFVGPIAVGVCLSVGTSLVIAMTIIPALAGYLMPKPQHAGRWWVSGWSSERLTRAYRASLDLCLRAPALGVAISLALPILGFVMSRTLSEQFFPPNDRNQFQLQIELPSQTSIAETERIAQQTRSLLHAHAEVVSSQWFLGESAPRVFYNMMGSRDGMASFAGAFVTTRSATDTERLLGPLQRELTHAVPNARILALPFEQGPPFSAPIEVRLFGPNLGRLRELGEELRQVMMQTEGVTYTAAALSSGRPKLMVDVDEDEARVAGLGLVDVARQLDINLEGLTAGSILEATEELPVRVRQGDPLRGDLGRIASQSLVAPGASARAGAGADWQAAPLSAISTLDLVPEIASATHFNGERSNNVQAFLVPYTLIADSLADFHAKLEASDFTLPVDYRMSLGGEAEQREEAVGNLLVFAFPLLIVMAGTIILTFNSFRLAAVIGCVAVLSVGLAMMGVWLFGYPLGFLAVVGTMGLVGLAINGGIVVLAALRADPAALRGERDAIRDVVVGATRHILGTTLTTIGGFIPLIFFGGRFWPPMATAIAGGVGGAAILSLYLVPSLFVWISAAGSLPVRAATAEGVQSTASQAIRKARARRDLNDGPEPDLGDAALG